MGLYGMWATVVWWSMAMAIMVEQAASQALYLPRVSFLLDCGGQSNSTIDDRLWLSDNYTTKYLSGSPITASSSSSSSSNPNTYSPLISTALIFPTQASYTFPVSPGRYWIRFYFYPFLYQKFNLSSSLFSLTAQQFSLFSNFSVSDAILSVNPSTTYLFKEYSINVTTTSLDITFLPNNGSYAFVNALEVVSMPDGLITDDISPLGTNAPTPIGMPHMALETMYRINVGGPLVTPANDTGLYRTWLPNESFLYSTAGIDNVNTSVNSIIYGTSTSEEVAPRIVYSTALEMGSPQTTDPQSLNISWVFPIVAGYQYVIRLHFCELVYNVGGKRVFNIYLQNQTAYSDLDLGGRFPEDRAYYVDFSVLAGGDTSLWIQAGPPPNSNSGVFNKAIVNGIEIWKLNNTFGSLDGLAVGNLGSKSHSKTAALAGAVIGGMIAFVLLFVGVCFFCRRKAKTVKQSSAAWLPLPMLGGNSVSLASKVSTLSHKSGTGSYVSSAPSSLGRVFTYAEIHDATHNFDEALVLGVGGFGKVFLGEIDDGTKVAVKRGNPRSEQGIMEFKTEIEMLSKLRHRHLVSLIGFCEERCEMILVYEYMANGPLRAHLYGTDLPPLSWKQRLEICIGAARGLHYLHTGAAESIIHRDVKTTNILLDENFVAKVSDFGLSKTGPTLDRTHVTTAVKGSFGYLDPEYFRRQQLTEKSDVYSFGVVLMEVLCARPAVNPALPRDQVNIAEWAMHWQSMGMLDQIIDPHLAGTINMESLAKFGETAEKCLAEEGINRPAIGDVLWNLEYALQLQETALASDAGEDSSTNRILELPLLLPAQGQWEQSTVENHTLVESEEESEDATVSAVFSQLVNPQGR